MKATLRKCFCIICKSEFHKVHINGKPFGPCRCQICGDKFIKEQEEIKQGNSKAQRLTKWLFLCPVQYRENKIDLIDQEHLLKVFDWKFGETGMMCTGESQRGKTTSCWRLLERLYLKEGIPFTAMTEPEFSIQAQRHGRTRTFDEWIDKLCNTKILFLDDIGHSATTSKHLEDLYYVVEKRTSWKKPIISTTQFSQNEFESRAYGSASKTVTAIINRLRKSSEIVNF